MSESRLDPGPTPRVPGPTSASAPYNVGADLLERNLPARAAKTAFIDDAGAHSFAEVADRANRCGNALLGIGLKPGERVIICLPDGVDFVATFLGAIKVGLTPVPINPLLPADDFAHLLADSGATAAVVSDAALPAFRPGAKARGWAGRLVTTGVALEGGWRLLDIADAAAPHAPTFPTTATDIAFWLYSSGSTGPPKGVLHRHGSPVETAKAFAIATLGLSDSDVILSAAKLFFAYGLGNALTFPLYAGATAILHAGRMTPEAVWRLVRSHGVTVFCGVPTLFSTLLASPELPPAEATSLRFCLSAGEALPEALGEEWEARTGAPIIDGIGSTEMLHVFVSNRPGNVRYGALGQPVPGYEIKLLDEMGRPVRPGELGEGYVRGPSSAAGYWKNPEKSQTTFVDGWVRTGDRFVIDVDGRLVHRGRGDDMLKVSGIWVSPTEVENLLVSHEAVLEAAVIGAPDARGLIKTKAYVVLMPGFTAGPALAKALQAFAKSQLAPHKYPRLIEFVDELPKTATGKIQRHRLREAAAAAHKP